MRYDAKFVDDVVVVFLRDRLTIGSGEEALRYAVVHYLEKGLRKFVLDLAGVIALDSSGSGGLVSAYTSVTSRGGFLVLSRLPEKVQDIMTINQLITIFDVYDDVESAVKAVRSKPLSDLG